MQDTDDPYSGMAGCGMGMYAIVLFVICGIGVIGMFGATIGLINSEPEQARSLVHGSEVAVWRLQPMRDVGLLQLTEVPSAWHDESPRFDGVTACLLTTERVGRITDGQALSLAWHQVRSTEVERTGEQQMTIHIIGDAMRFACHFGPNEGANRFLRMVDAEQKNADAD